jgi:ABC-type transport system substrate-binding protein
MTMRTPNRWATVFVGLAVLATACQPRQSAGPAGSGGQQPAASPSDPGARQAGQPAGPQPKRGGTLTMAIQKDMALMNPLVGTKSTDQSIRELMFEPLLNFDAQSKLQPQLAESWDLSSDGRLYTLKLRQGVKFHNGQEMTAEDVKFSIEYTMNPKNGAYGFKTLSLVDRVETPDRYTVQITMKRPNAAFLTTLTQIKTVSIVPNGSLAEGVDKPTTFPAGTGPFRFVEWQPRQRIVVERFDDYWGQKAYVDRVALVPIQDDSVRLTALRSGDVDVVERTPYEWVKEIKDGRLSGLGFAEARYAGYRRLMFNAADPPFDNRKLRQAMAHALDRSEVLQAAYFGFGEAAEQKYPRGHAWYFDGVRPPALDLDRARALLREAGYNGETIELQSDDSTMDQTEATIFQAQLRKIGVNIKILAGESGSLSAMQRRGEFAFTFSGSSFDPDPSTMYGGLRCEPDPRRRSDNSAAYCDKEMDALLERGETELDAGKRRDIYRQIVAKALDDIPELPLGFVPRFFTFRDHVKGFTTDGEGRFMHQGGGLNYAWLDK